MDEGKKVPITVDGDIVGTAMLLPDGEIVVELNTSPRGLEFQNFLSLGALENLSIGESPISETKETNNG